MTYASTRELLLPPGPTRPSWHRGLERKRVNMANPANSKEFSPLRQNMPTCSRHSRLLISGQSQPRAEQVAVESAIAGASL
jgi:hypothetical protein